MNEHETKLFEQCLLAAKRIVDAEKVLYNNHDALAFDVSVSGGTTSTSFAREGTSGQQKEYNLPSDLAKLIQQGYLTSGVPSDVAANELTMLNQFLKLVPEMLPGLTQVVQNYTMDPTSFTGSDTLESIAGRNPYSQNWETGTQDLYNRSFAQGRAATMSGPDNVRGGQARAGFEAADFDTQASINRFREVAGQQQAEAGVVGDAIKTSAAIEAARRGTILGAQNQQVVQESMRRGTQLQVPDALGKLRGHGLASNTMGAEFLAKPKVTTTDNLRGEGNQSTFNWGSGAGVSCCFILLAATGGELPWFVRYCRDHLGTEETRRGYRRMARWLVPLMQRWSAVRLFVEATMVHPLIQYGGYLTRQEGYEGGFVFRPVKRVWFAIWNYLGKEK